MACHMKAFVRFYWGSGLPGATAAAPPLAVPHNHPLLTPFLDLQNQLELRGFPTVEQFLQTLIHTFAQCTHGYRVWTGPGGSRSTP
jgi:hypothetical protein